MAPAIALQVCPVTNMVEAVKDTLLGAFRQLLRPLVRILLRSGVSFSEYAEISKVVFVEVAARDFPLGAQKSTQSRIAILTGLTRKDVARVTDIIESKAAPTTANLNRIGRVLAGWHQDPDFTGPYGLPLELEFDSKPRGFTDLVRRYSGDLPPRAMLDELKRVGAVNVLPAGRIKVLTRSYIPTPADPAGVQFMGVALRDLAETLDLNLNQDPNAGYFERRVWTPAGIDPSAMPEFDALVNEKGQEFLEMLDNWITGKETDAESIPPDQKIRVGVGVYLFSDANRSFRED
jgi:hypothetical protein